MNSQDFVHKVAVKELTKKLPSLAKHDYNTIDTLMKSVAKKHRISHHVLHDVFLQTHKKSPDSWIKDSLQEDNGKFETPIDQLEKEAYAWFKANASKGEDWPYEVGFTFYLDKTGTLRRTALVQGDEAEVVLPDPPKGCIAVGSLHTHVGSEGELSDFDFEEGQREANKTGQEYYMFVVGPSDEEGWMLSDQIFEPDESLTEDITSNSSRQREVDKFVDWACGILKIENKPEIELSDDTEEAQNNHHTGGHTPGEDSIWVYAKNRNMVDILRTVFHELVHVRQGELDMIKPGSSYPGSPIEAQADMLAGKYIKIYGEKNHHIFENKKRLTEMVDIPIGKGRATTKCMSTLYHSLRGRSLGPEGQIQGYQLSPKEIELQDMWREPSQDGYVWLSPNAFGPDSLQIDVRKLNLQDLRFTGQSEGYVLHKGSIPAEAIYQKR